MIKTKKIDDVITIDNNIQYKNIVGVLQLTPNEYGSLSIVGDNFKIKNGLYGIYEYKGYSNKIEHGIFEVSTGQLVTKIFENPQGCDVIKIAIDYLNSIVAIHGSVELFNSHYKNYYKVLNK